MHAEIFESAENGTLKVAPHSIPHLQHCPLIPIAAPASTLPTRVESPLWKEGSSARPPTCFSQFMLKSVAPSVLRVSLPLSALPPPRLLARSPSFSALTVASNFVAKGPKGMRARRFHRRRPFDGCRRPPARRPPPLPNGPSTAAPKLRSSHLE